MTRLADRHFFSAMMGSIVLLWWVAMMILQGEGLELDLQRRRHPMWEWLFSHPVSSRAVFAAEVLSPLAANPIYWAAPLFVGILYGEVYDPALGILAALTAGVPISVAAACLGKALEIGSIIRFSPRSRGALLGLMGWMGYASMMLFFLGASSISRTAASPGAGPRVGRLARCPGQCRVARGRPLGVRGLPLGDVFDRVQRRGTRYPVDRSAGVRVDRSSAFGCTKIALEAGLPPRRSVSECSSSRP